MPRNLDGHRRRAIDAKEAAAGVFFGADVTEHFCALNRVSLVIRSHECVPEGYQYMHGDRLVTIFSASRYCGRGTNRGAFLQFDANLDQTVRQFVATDLEDTAPALVPPAQQRLGSSGVTRTW